MKVSISRQSCCKDTIFLEHLNLECGGNNHNPRMGTSKHHPIAGDVGAEDGEGVGGGVVEQAVAGGDGLRAVDIVVGADGGVGNL